MRDDPGDTANSAASQLSAFLDGELPHAEAELLIRRLERDGELKRSLAHFALIGEVMRTPAGSHGVIVSKGFAARVRTALAAEVPEQPAQADRTHAATAARWLKPAVGLSIAAGVAALMIAVFGTAPEQPPTAASGNGVSADEQNRGQLAEASYIVPEITVTGPLVPAARLANYVMAHSEYSSPLGRRNVLSGMLADDTATSSDDAVPAGFIPVAGPAP